MWDNEEEGTEIGDAGQSMAPLVHAEAESGQMLIVSASTSGLGVTREERTWAAVAHASILLTLLLGLASGGIGALLGMAIPAIIWYVHRDKSDYVVDQARQATLFQLAGFVALLVLVIGGVILLVVGWVISAVLTIVLVGLLLALAMVVVTVILVAAVIALPIAQVVYGCYAAIETYNGKPFRYWWIADLADRYQADTQR
jgi:uncharacterized Tic20 family protein